MKEKVLRAMTMLTVACWNAGENGYNYSVELSKDKDTEIEIYIDTGDKSIYYNTIEIEDPLLDELIDQMVIDIAEKTKEIV